MNAVEFQVIREGLGYTRGGLASELDVKEQTLRHWELGRRVIPNGVADEMNQRVRKFVDRLDEMVDEDELVIDGTSRESRAIAWVAMLDSV